MINLAHGREDKRMAAGTNRQILLVEKPAGKLGPEHFRLVEAAIPEPKDGEAISLDAANRAWMHGATYRAAPENTPSALIGLLAGKNRGKRMVRV
jgi:NADPH-dependent curcumin reductase CurA